MARDWVKLYTCILDDADINGLTPETGWSWARMIALAGRNEDNGRIGTAKNIAFVLHSTVPVIDAAVAELEGRILVDDEGELWFRDWQDWQAQSDRERQRSSRAAKKAVTAPSTPEVVTESHDASRPVTNGHDNEKRTSSVQFSSEESTNPQPDFSSSTSAREPDAPNGAANGSSPEAVDNGGYARPWDPFYEDCGVLWGQSGIRKDGSPYAWAGSLAQLFGRFAHEDVNEARRLLRSWSKSDEFKFAQQPTLAPPKAGKWLTENAAFFEAVQR